MSGTETAGDGRKAEEASKKSTTGRNIGISTGVATMFLLLRLLAVSDWNWSSAAAIADSFDFSDVFPIVFGTLFARPVITGVVIAILLPIAVLRMVWPIGSKRVNFSLGRVLFTAALIACTVAWDNTFRSWWVSLTGGVVAAVLVAIRLIWRHGIAHRAVAWILGSIGALTATAVLLLAALIDTPWMSREELVLPDGPVEGYVLEAEPGFLKVLTDDHDVRIIPTGEVSARTIVD